MYKPGYLIISLVSIDCFGIWRVGILSTIFSIIFSYVYGFFCRSFLTGHFCNVTYNFYELCMECKCKRDMDLSQNLWPFYKKQALIIIQCTIHMHYANGTLHLPLCTWTKHIALCTRFLGQTWYKKCSPHSIQFFKLAWVLLDTH